MTDAPPLARIGLIGAGEMGAAVGSALVASGRQVMTDPAGRSPETLSRIEEAGLIGAAPDEVIGGADLILSIVPPEKALAVGRDVAERAERLGVRPLFLEANAISPDLANQIAEALSSVSVVMVDGGIIGMPPGDQGRPRLYVSGSLAGRVLALDGHGVDVVDLGGAVGQASAFKMLYASLTKGTNALLTNAMLAAERAGLLTPYLKELRASQPALAARAAVIPALPSDAGRWVREMEEIRDTYTALGLPGDFHQGAAEIMRILDQSRFGAETRRTRDRARTFEDTVQAIIADLQGGRTDGN